MKKQNINEFYTIFALLALMLGATVLYHDFLSPENIFNLAKQVTLNGILAVGMTTVILTGGIDLSIGSIVAFSGMIVGILQVNYGWGQNDNIQLAIITSILAVFFGALLGFLNGLMIAFTKIPPFIITLGMMQIARGLSQIFLKSTALSPMSEPIKFLNKGVISKEISIILFVLWFVFIGYNFFKNRNRVFSFIFQILVACFTAYSFLTFRGIPVPILFLVVSAIIIQFILGRTPLGRYIYALGGNEEASLLSGIPVPKVKLFVYTIMGLLSGLAGLLLTARINSADPNSGLTFELDAIAAVVIGGTSLMGGKGTLSGSLVGAMIISVINNGMSLMGIDSIFQMVIKGVILVLAVWFDSRKK